MINKAKIAVLGSGTMGAQLAALFAFYKYDVIVWDIRKIEAIKQSVNAVGKPGIFDKITITNELADIKEVEFVCEAIVEQLEIKKKVLSEVDRLCGPDTILASNTSSLDLEQMANELTHPERLVGAHFFNPPREMKLVEVIKTRFSSELAVQKTVEYIKSMKKQPVIVNNSPGFIVNHLLIPLINEASKMLMNGVASAEEIDKAMRLGANHPLGPLALGDLIGLDIVKNILEELATRLQDDHYAPSPLLCDKVSQNHLGRKTGAGFYNYAK